VVAEAQNAWRCSQCGAINEPGSRACQGCGKWPSLFDLQDSVDAEPEAADFDRGELDLFEDGAFDHPEAFDPEAFDPEAFEPETFEPVPGQDEEGDEPEAARWKSILSGVVVPLALVVYFVISFLADR
jgi:hypothetical protein